MKKTIKKLATNAMFVLFWIIGCVYQSSVCMYHISLEEAKIHSKEDVLLTIGSCVLWTLMILGLWVAI